MVARFMRQVSRLFSVALLAGWALLACTPKAFDGRIYHSGDLYFRVGSVPGTWRAVTVDEALLAFRDDSESATIAVNGRCGVDGDDVPLVSLTQHLFLQFSDRTIVAQKPLTLDGREALRTELVAALDGVKKRYLVYVIKKNGCVYDFMYIAGDDRSGAASGEFERFVQGFATLE